MTNKTLFPIKKGENRPVDARKGTHYDRRGRFRAVFDIEVVVAKDPLQPSRCANLLKALAEPERLRIIDLLRGGPKTVGEIAEELRSEFVNVSHHLTVLRAAGLVKSTKKGRFVTSSLAPGLLQSNRGDADFLNLGCCRLELPDPPPPSPASAEFSR